MAEKNKIKTILIPGAKNYQINENGTVTNVKHGTPVFPQSNGQVSVMGDNGKTITIENPKEHASKLFKKSPEKVVTSTPSKSIPDCEDYIMGCDGTIIDNKGNIILPKNKSVKIKSTEGGDYTILDVEKLHGKLFPGCDYTADRTKGTPAKEGKKSSGKTTAKSTTEKASAGGRTGNKIKEIRDLFAAGKSNADIISLGYNKSTVGVQRGKWNKEERNQKIGE